MHPRLRLIPVLGLALGVVVSASGRAAPPGGIAPRTESDPQVISSAAPREGAPLADTVTLARVGDRITRVRDFTFYWFNAWPPDLPEPDSAGRAEFLASIVSRDLMALEAARLNIPVTFEDRLAIREYRQRMLGNILYRRVVVDSVRISEEDVKRHWESFRYEVRASHILFRDEETAQQVRADLLAHKLTWEEAVTRYSLDDSTRADAGSLGWLTYGRVGTSIAIDIFPLTPGTLSPVFRDDDGFHIARVDERRPARAPDFNSTRALVRMYLEQHQTAVRLGALHDVMRRRIHLTYDDANCAWARRQFVKSFEVTRGALGTQLAFNDIVPEFLPEDTSRVLARFDGGTLSLGQFVTKYSEVQTAARPDVSSPGLFRRAVDSFILEPAMAEEALLRGLENDPVSVKNLRIKHEELAVRHLYQDSVLAQVSLTPKERRKFYEKNRTAYITFPSVRYALFGCKEQRLADTLAARLRAGESAERVLADSLYGWSVGTIASRRQSERGAMYKLLFETLRPGQVEVQGPNKDGGWAVVQSLSYDPGRQLSYEEAANYVDENLQKIRGEEQLAAFSKRLMKRYPTWSHPEILMRVRLAED